MHEPHCRIYPGNRRPIGPEPQGWARVCETYEWLEKELGEERRANLRPVTDGLHTFEQAEQLADEERRRLELGLAPAHVLLAVLEERVGIKVVDLDLDETLSGASVVSARFGPAILVNRRHRAANLVYTVAHQLFHLLVREKALPTGRSAHLHVCTRQAGGDEADRVEDMADRFAVRLLLPPDHLIERLKDFVMWDGIARSTYLVSIARYFGVSVPVVFMQLALLKLAPLEQAVNSYRDPPFQEAIMHSGLEPGPERFRRLAVNGYLSERLSRGRLAELLGINVGDVDGVLRHYGAPGATRGIGIPLPR